MRDAAGVEKHVGAHAGVVGCRMGNRLGLSYDAYLSHQQSTAVGHGLRTVFLNKPPWMNVDLYKIEPILIHTDAIVNTLDQFHA